MSCGFIKYYYVAKQPKVGGITHNHHFVMLMDSADQELGKGTAGTACSCSTVSGASIEKPQSLGVARQLGWTHLKHVSSHVWCLGWKDTETKPTESTHSPST